MKYDSNTAIVVMTCDSYSDLWHDYFALKAKYWGNCKFITYIVTEEKECTETNTITIKCGFNTEWSERLRIALKQIEQRYIILTLEDFYFAAPIDATVIEEAVALVESDGIMYYKFYERYHVRKKLYKGLEHLHVIPPSTRYGISVLTAIWDRNYLLNVIKDENYSAWEFELLRNRIDDITKREPQLCIYDNRHLLHLLHMIERGKYLSTSVAKLRRKGYRIDSSIRGTNGYWKCVVTSFQDKLHGYEPLRRMLVKVLHFFGKKTVSETYEDKYGNSLNKLH